MRRPAPLPSAALLVLVLLPSTRSVSAATTIRIMPADRATLAAGQRFDIRVEATGDGGQAPRGLTVMVDGRDITAQNVLDPGRDGERGAGGTGATGAALEPRARAGGAAGHTTNFLVRDFSLTSPGPHVVSARTSDGAEGRVTVSVLPWQAGRPGAARARNIILLLGDGMGAAHRTAARVVSRGMADGKARAPLAMDTMEVTGQVMTASLNAVVTDSAPGMSSYANGQKGNNNQAGVYPDNTPDPFDNPRAEYVGALLRRTRGSGFTVGIVTTADVTDATPTANAVHTADRDAGPGIAARFFDERQTSGLTVLMGGGARHFVPKGSSSSRADDRDLAQAFASDGYARLSSRADVTAALAAPPPARVLGLFHPRHLAVAFDKIGAGRYSRELAQPKHAAVRDQPLLEEMAQLAIASLSTHSPEGFYLMIEGASIDKQSHDVDPERAIWDTIEFDRAVDVALRFARRTNTDGDPGNDTLVVATADHECGGMAIIGVGNERYAPAVLGKAVRDYAAVFRFLPEQTLDFETGYATDAQGYPTDPDPLKKLLVGWAAGPDRFENWVSNRLALPPAVVRQVEQPGGGTDSASVANPDRDGDAPTSDNRTVDGRAIAGFLVSGSIENGASGCPDPDGCPADTESSAHTIAGHTGTDVPLSATGAGAWQFTGTYDNSDVFVKLLRAAAGSYPVPGAAPAP